MIYTVTLNPSIDYIARVNHFRAGVINRTTYEYLLPGGKGINVSQMLKNLGHPSVVLGFSAGFSGKYIEEMLRDREIVSELIDAGNGFSRINLKLKAEEETEINGQGPVLGQEHLNLLEEKLSLLREGDCLVLSGNVPRGMGENTYTDILKKVYPGVLTVVDAAGNHLLNCLGTRPFFVKPNREEISEMFGVEVNDVNGCLYYAKKLQEKGARNVIVSMAGDGAVLAAENGETYYCSAPKGTVVQSVGAGDSMVAGFLAGWLEKHEYSYSLMKAAASGSASAFSEDFGTLSEVEALMNKMEHPEEIHL